MSYDLAFWVGPLPSTHDEAAAEFKRLYAVVHNSSTEPPAPELLAFLSVATKHYPEDDEDDGDDSVWGEGPLLNCIRGPLFYVPIVRSRADDVSRFLGNLAMKMNLVAFDPQKAELIGSDLRKREGKGPEIVAKAGINREPGFLYFLRGRDVHRTAMVPLGQKRGAVKDEIIYSGTFDLETGYLYFIATTEISRAFARRPSSDGYCREMRRTALKIRRPNVASGLVCHLGIRPTRTYASWWSGASCAKSSLVRLERVQEHRTCTPRSSS